LRVCENRVLRRIFGQKRTEMVGGLRKLHNEDLRNLYFSPKIIRMIKPRRMRWTGLVARMGRRGMHTGYWCKIELKNHYEDLDVDERVILKLIIEK
jgi:hypothetical protein